MVLGRSTSAQVNGTTALTFRFISMQPYDCLFLCSQKLSSSAMQDPRGNCETLMQIVS